MSAWIFLRKNIFWILIIVLKQQRLAFFAILDFFNKILGFVDTSFVYDCCRLNHLKVVHLGRLLSLRVD